MLPYLSAAGIEPVFAIFYTPGQGVESEIVRQGYDVRRLASRTALGKIRELRRLIRDERPDLIHTTILEASLVGRAAAVRTSVPVLSSLVNLSYDRARLGDPHLSRAKLEVVRQLDGWTARHWTTHFHAISQTVRGAAIQRLGIDPLHITVVERGRDSHRLGRLTAERRSTIRRLIGIDPEAEVAVHVGRQEYQKGQRFLLEAFELLAPKRPGLVILIAGRKGSASPLLEGLRSRSSFPDRIHFLGYREDVPDVMAAADVFVFPSLFEGQGCALIEAMGLGLPIVASDIPVLREAVQDGWNGLLVPPASARALAQAIARALDERDLAARLGEHSREIFHQRYSIERSAERMIDLYQRVVAGPRSSLPVR